MPEKKKRVVPRLRFPEFRNAGPWEVKRLGEISNRIIEKVGDRKLVTVSITAGKGFVTQEEKFGRDISGRQYKNYILLKRGQFAYNKGNSKTFPQGAVYQLREFDKAAVPNAFYSFEFKMDYVPGFFIGYFENNFHGKQLAKFITSSARNDGLLNVNAGDFFSILLPIPKDKEEQQKIADCLGSLDDLIRAEEAALEALNRHKKGLMQQLFPREGETTPRLRFPEFRNAGPWTKQKLAALEKQGALSLGRGNVISKEDINRNPGSYPIYSSSIKNNGIFGYYGHYMFDEELITWSIDGGGNFFYRPKHKFSVTNVSGYMKLDTSRLDYRFLAHQLMLLHSRLQFDYLAKAHPSVIRELYSVAVPAIQEQKKIGDCLSLFDDLIRARSERIEALKQHKKGLMQQLFPQEID